METNEALHFMRETLDKKRFGSTPQERVTRLASFFMTSSFDEGDPLVELSPFIPQDTDLTAWYEHRRSLIERLRREDPRDHHSDRHDLEVDTKDQFKNSSWIVNADRATHLLPFASEVQEATIVLKLLYKEAAYAYEHLQTISAEESHPILTDIA